MQAGHYHNQDIFGDNGNDNIFQSKLEPLPSYLDYRLLPILHYCYHTWIQGDKLATQHQTHLDRSIE